MNLKQILSKLREGSKLQMKWESPLAREKFRTNLYRVKQQEDKLLKDILEEDKLVLKWEPRDAVHEVSAEYYAKFWLEKKPSDEDYEVEVIDE